METKKIKFKFFFLSIKDQGPFKRFVKNLYKGHVFGLLSKRSHFNGNGIEKVGYKTKKSSLKACEKMGEKHGKHFSSYRCMYCGKYHIGKNRENK